MLPYALAIAVGLSSSLLFVTAFFFKDIHRQDDFFWSGIGLFYALVLWFCATSITGAVLLGQLAVVALLIAYFWQVIKLRKAIANPDKRDNLDSFSVVSFFKNLFQRSSSSVAPTKKLEEAKDTVVETQETQEEAPSSVAETTETNETVETVIETKKEPSTSAADKVSEAKTQPTTSENSTTQVKESTPKEASEQESKTDLDTPQNQDNSEDSANATPSLTNTKLNDILDAAEPETKMKETDTSEAPDTSVATPSDTETPVKEVAPSDTEITETTETTETTEIAVETMNVVEEETNWDDEVEDIPASSIKVIEEVTPSETSPSPEEKSPSKPTDSTASELEKNTTEAESKNKESSDKEEGEKQDG